MPAATSSDSNDILQLRAEAYVKNRSSQLDALTIMKLFTKENFYFVPLRLCWLHHCHFLIFTQSVIKIRDILSLKMSDVIRCLSSRGSQKAVQHWLSLTNIYKERRQYCGQGSASYKHSIISLFQSQYETVSSLTFWAEELLNFPHRQLGVLESLAVRERGGGRGREGWRAC